MSFESLLCRPYETDELLQTAHAFKGEIAQRLPAASEASSSYPKYDIFLSFRGLDTRKKFTDHLYKALKEEGFRTFRDDNEIERGENIKPELQKAIRNSRMSVIVLSKNYANSTACLFELQTILEYRKASDHIVLPVFYDVDPSEIKEHAEKLNFEKKKIEEVPAWSAALKEVASMAGFVSQNQSNGYEAPLIQDILECIDNKILDLPFFVLDSMDRLFRKRLRLMAQAEDVRAKVRSEMLQIWKKPKKEVEVWLSDVESFNVDVQGLKQQVFGESRFHSRVQLRKNIDEKIQEAAELEERGRALNDNLLVAFPIDIVLWKPPTNLESVEARNAERIREYLRETLSVM